MPTYEPERGGAARASAAANRATIPRPIRIEPAFADREFVRELFNRHAPYRALAAYLPDGSDEPVKPGPLDGRCGRRRLFSLRCCSGVAFLRSKSLSTRLGAPSTPTTRAEQGWELRWPPVDAKS